MATRSIDSRDLSSPAFNHTHANQMIDLSAGPRQSVAGVSMLAAFRPLSGIEIPVRPRSLETSGTRQPRDHCRSMELSGLPVSACSLNPILPGARSTRTLAGFCILFDAARRALPSNPPNLAKPASSNGGHRASISDDAVSTYKLCSCGPEIPAIPKRVLPSSLPPVAQDRVTFSLRTGACVRSSPRPAPGR